MGGVVQAGVEIGQWDVGNSYKMEGKAGASWGGIFSSLRSCHATISPEFPSPLCCFSLPSLFFIFGDPGADSAAEENSKRAEKNGAKNRLRRCFSFRLPCRLSHVDITPVCDCDIIIHKNTE